MNIQEFYKNLSDKYASGNSELIEAYLSEVVEKSCPIPGEYNAVFLSAINELGAFCRGAGRYKEAEEAFNIAAATILREMGMHSVEYATNRNNMAGNLRLMGEYSKAIALFEEAGRLYEKIIGREDYLYASNLNNMALCYTNMKEIAKAESCLLQALEVIKKIPGKSEKEAITLVNLAALTHQRGYLNDAFRIYAQLTDKGVHYGSALNLQGVLDYEEGKYRESIKMFEEAKGEIYKYFGASEEYNMVCESIKQAMVKLENRW